MAMRISTFGYFFGEGFKSVNRNRMMSLASVSTVMASLLILGIFFITMSNVNYMVKNVESGVEIKVFLKNDATNDQKSAIETEMKKAEGVTDVSFESKQEAMENFKKQLGDNGDLVAGVDPEKVMPNSYIIKMEGPKYVDNVVQKLKTMDGIDEIKDGRQFLDKLMNITNFIKTLGITLMVILLVVAVFLISNTIKLTVMARRREIGIMKYIGATNWFIRWPFVVEGVLLGLLGALVSGAIVGYGYTIAVDALTKNLIVGLLSPIDVIPTMLAMFGVIGVGLGFLGSTLSMRKFLNV
jgi:Cell division protein